MTIFRTYKNFSSTYFVETVAEIFKLFFHRFVEQIIYVQTHKLVSEKQHSNITYK